MKRSTTSTKERKTKSLVPYNADYLVLYPALNNQQGSPFCQSHNNSEKSNPLVQPISIPILRKIPTALIDIFSTNIKEIFTRLKPLLNPRQNLSRLIEKSECFNLSKLPGNTYLEKIQHIINNDNSLLNIALTSLAAGHRVSLPNRIKAKIYIASENIRLAVDGRFSELRQIVTDATFIQGSEAQNQLMCYFGYCYSTTTLVKHAKRRTEIAKVELEDHQLPKGSFMAVMYDNLGFRCREGLKPVPTCISALFVMQ